MEVENRGTIKEKANFDDEAAAKRFKLAMKGLGSDEAAIISLLVSHSSLQRQAIEEKYKKMYGRDLVDDLKDELGGHFEDAVVAMMTSPYSLLVDALHSALSGAGTDADVLTEILCCRSTADIESLSWWYEKRHGRTLDEALEDDLNGDFRDLMRGLASGSREEEGPTDSAKARKDAQDLYDAGIGANAGSEESEFIAILNTRSFAQLNPTFQEYENISQEAIEESIKKEFSGDLMDGLLSIVKRVRDPPGFFAERLHNSIAGSGTDDKTLIRLLVSRSEVDLADIKVCSQVDLAYIIVYLKLTWPTAKYG
ncbi:annexin B9 isoform X2 [Hyalella azteca]|uniref:Annexin B9 isoform X2 n=1 Tax=Hyalella azteca TaxID=294128 RepID=A0A979FQU1_HYAAZ|nr:annexin B9 isoform X2 [Hyalella azteca]